MNNAWANFVLGGEENIEEKELKKLKPKLYNQILKGKHILHNLHNNFRIEVYLASTK